MQITHAGVGFWRARACSTGRRGRSALLCSFCARIVAVAMVVAFAIGGLMSAQALAGTITVWGCRAPNGTPAPLDRWASAAAYGINNTNSCASGGSFGTTISQVSHPAHTTGTWTFSAPAGTSVTGFAYRREAWRTQWADVNLFSGTTANWDGTHQLEACGAVGGCPGLPYARVSFGGLPDLDGMLILTEACAAEGGCDSSSWGYITVYGTEVTLSDETAPSVGAVSGTLATANTLAGRVGATIDAQDSGTGVYRVRVLIDGTVVSDVVADANGGKCASLTGGRDFLYAVPCRLATSFDATLDTTRLTEGAHQLLVRVEDASGNVTTALNRQVTVDNVPSPSGGSPSIAGELYAGTTLTAKPGTWSNADGGFSYAWLRCDTAGEGCEQIATGATYTLTLFDVGCSIRLRMTAANSAGETTIATTQPTALVAERSSTATGSSGVAGTTPPTPQDSAGGSGAPNGQNASSRATLRVGFPRGRQTFRTTWGARRIRIAGRLLNAVTGQPIAGAMVEEITRASASGARNAPSRWLRTDTAGGFSMVIARTAPGESLTFQYRAQTGTSAPVVASARLRLRVIAKIAWRASSSHRVLRFSGSLSRPVPAHPVQYVEVQWRRGGGWATLAYPVRVRPNGRWSLSYPVGANVATGARFRFRVAIRATSPNYPYETASTPARWVTVR